MSKKKTNSRAKRKEQNVNQSSNQTNKQNQINKQNQTTKNNTQSTYNKPQELKLTAYTTVAMFAVLIATAASALSMIILAKPVHYLIDSRIGGIVDEMTIDSMAMFLKEDELDKFFKRMLIIMAVITIIVALISFVNVIRSMNPSLKPNIILNIIAFALSVVALILYFVAANDMSGELTKLLPETSKVFGMFNYLMIGLIANVAILLVNIFTSLIGMSRWERDGKAF